MARSLRASCWVAAAVIAVVALLGRALVPAGYMPDPARAGELVICTGHGPLTPSHRRGGERGVAAAVCPFAVNVAPHAPPAPPTLAPSVVAERLDTSRPGAETPVRALFVWRRPPSTGPPIRV